MADKLYVRFTLSHEVRLVWESVITPKAEHKYNGSIIPAKFEAKFLIGPTHPDREAIIEIVNDLAAQTFGPNFSETHPGLKFPISTGDKLADEGRAMDPPKDREFFRGMGVIDAHSAYKKQNGQLAKPPGLILYRGEGDYRVFGEDERMSAKPFFYNGVEVLGEFSFSPYTGMGGGVTCYINELVSMNTGERLAGATDLASKYGAAASRHVGTVHQVDPTVGAEVYPREARPVSRVGF